MTHLEGELVRLHDGALSADEAQRVLAHLAECADCRELDEAIAFSRRLLVDLPSVDAQPSDIASARAAIVGAARPRRRLWPWVALAAALGAIAFLQIPRVQFVDAPPHVRTIERVARATTGYTVATTSRATARALVARSAGVSPPLRPNLQLLGVTPASPIATLVYERGVVLAVSRDLQDAPRSIPLIKRLEVRHDGDTRIFTWTASGDVYSLVVPPGVETGAGCGICHDGATTDVVSKWDESLSVVR